jgi:hypothetical protein
MCIAGSDVSGRKLVRRALSPHKHIYKLDPGPLSVSGSQSCSTLLYVASKKLYKELGRCLLEGQQVATWLE